MGGIGNLWAGKVFGTNTGNLFVEIESMDSRFEGTLRFLDDRFGLVLYSINGNFDGTAIEFRGEPTKAPQGIETAPISAKGILTPEGQIRGQWSSTIGTGGTFVLWPHDTSKQSETASGLLPERIHTATRTVGALRLYAEDIQELIGFLSRDFTQGRVIATYRERGNEISRYASDLQSDLSRLGELRYLKLLIQ